MRTCVIDIPGLNGRLLDRLTDEDTPRWLDQLLERGRSTIRPMMPAVTMPVQATYSTGKPPAEHGIIANGLPAYRLPRIRQNLDLENFADYRANVSFWEQSNQLLTAPRVWADDQRRVAMLFVQSSMHGAADVVVTPKPEHTPDGRTLSTCWSDPGGLYGRLKEQLGEFPLHHYWGPIAGMPSSEWIAAAARLVWDWEPTDLQWVYVPHMDYDLQRLGPGDQRCVEALGQVFALLTPLVEKVHADGGRVRVISEYGMTDVSRSIAPNVLLRRTGLLSVNGGGEVDYEESRCFAMCDHQVAHIYCADDAAAEEAERILSGLSEVDRAYRGPTRGQIGLDTERAGDLVLFAKPDAWFEYRWFEDFSEAPEFIWTIDIHRKPGYDPTEMFADRETRRIHADKPHLIRGSHGATPADEADWPLLIGHGDAPASINATDIADLVFA